MKDFFFHIIKRQILPILLVICLFLPLYKDIYPYIQNFTITARAEDVSSDPAISKATPLNRDSIYQNNFSTGSTHYYCLYSGTKKETISIRIESAIVPSVSFQLYDSQGEAISPLDYQFLSSGKVLELQYIFSSNDSFLLALESHSNNEIPYTIHYTVYERKEASSAKKENKVSSNTSKDNTDSNKNTKKTTSKQKVTKQKSTKPAISKQTTSKQETTKPISTKQTTSKHVTTYATKSKKRSSQKKTCSIKKLSLSTSFIQLKKGRSTYISAFLSPKKASGAYEWNISNSSILRIISKKKTRISFVAKRKGTTIITYRFSGKKKLSASCTIKIN